MSMAELWAQTGWFARSIILILVAMSIYSLTVAAIIGKQLCSLGAGRGLDRLTIGIGMIPRGEVGLIFAHLGLTNQILSSQVYSAILIMVMLTTFLAPPLLKPIFARKEPPPADEATASVPGHGHAPAHR